MSLKSNISVVIKLHSQSTTFYIANIVAKCWKRVIRNGQLQDQEWAYVFIPQINDFRWIPPTYFVAYAV